MIEPQLELGFLDKRSNKTAKERQNACIFPENKEETVAIPNPPTATSNNLSHWNFIVVPTATTKGSEPLPKQRMCGWT